MTELAATSDTTSGLLYSFGGLAPKTLRGALCCLRRAIMVPADWRWSALERLYVIFGVAPLSRRTGLRRGPYTQMRMATITTAPPVMARMRPRDEDSFCSGGVWLGAMRTTVGVAITVSERKAEASEALLRLGARRPIA